MLADLIPLFPKVKVPRRRMTRTQIQMRWVARNRDKFNAYRREWYARRKAA